MSRRVAPQTGMGERDQEILRDVGRLRFLSGGQLARLHFAQGTPVGRQRRAQATLRRLTEDGYLHRLPRRIGGVGSGSARFVYQLGFRGQKQIWPGRRARTPEESGWLFVEHAMAATELFVELVEAERAGQCQALHVQAEPAVWRHYVAPSGRVLVLKPDLGVRLLAGGNQRVWFVEVDRSTEGLKQIRTKASRYLDYWRSGREQQRLGTFPRVLWSVPDEQRAAALRRTLVDLPDPASEMFVVTEAASSTRALLGQPTNEEGGEK